MTKPARSKIEKKLLDRCYKAIRKIAKKGGSVAIVYHNAEYFDKGPEVAEILKNDGFHVESIKLWADYRGRLEIKWTADQDNIEQE